MTTLDNELTRCLFLDQSSSALSRGLQSDAVPQRLKPPTIFGAYGVAEATPLQNEIKLEFFRSL
jgi:hypothetical protein